MAFDFASVRYLLIDMDGVLYRGRDALLGASDLIAWLRRSSIPFQLVTNNATLTPLQYQQKLAAMRMQVETAEIMTSSLATGLYLKREASHGDAAFVIGEDGIRIAVQDAGLRLVDAGGQWVVVGLDRTLTYNSLATAALAIQSGAKFVGTNPDTSFPTELGLTPGAGAILKALSATTGVEPVVVGKPQPLMLELAMERLGSTNLDTVMLGDRLDTDIAGAQAAGMRSILVLTGVSSRRDVERLGISPTLIVDDLENLTRTWEAQRGSMKGPGREL